MLKVTYPFQPSFDLLWEDIYWNSSRIGGYPKLSTRVEKKRERKKVWIWWMRKISNIVHIHWNIFNSHINTFNSHNIFIVKVISVLLQLHTVEKTPNSQPSYEYIRVQSLWPHIWSHMLKVCFSFSLLHKQFLSCTLKQELSYHVRFNTVFECSLENFRHN